MSDFFNHLWQSTVFAAAIALACFFLRRNSPRLRYWLWLTASVKFLVPFSLLVWMGATLVRTMGTHVPMHAGTTSVRATTVEQISGYFAPVSMIAVPIRAAFPWQSALTTIWILGALFLITRWSLQWRAVYLAARGSTRVPSSLSRQTSTPILSSPALLEPGVFGLFQPVILLPHGICDNLTPEQFQAILAHELCHVRYRDNLTAAVHMCVETLFWFHPAVWLIGARLIDERERDCDEVVLRQGSRPSDYARGIVQVCETYLESPLLCAPGISGSDLKKRIREIMKWQRSLPITLHGRAMLTMALLAAVSAPILIGVLRAQTLPPAPTYTYDVVSIHRSDPAARDVHIGPGPQGGLRTGNTPVLLLLSVAYKVQKYQIVGAPAWVRDDRFDVTFTPDKSEMTPGPNSTPTDFQGYLNRNGQRLQAVLRDRFGLVLRSETRALPVFALIQAKNGSKLTPAPDRPGPPSIQTNGNRQITSTNATMEMLAQQLSMELGQPVYDETALSGRFNFKLDWAPDLNPSSTPSPDEPANPNPLPGVSIFTAMTEQLGLRLQAKTGPVQVYVIEKIERPTEN